MLNRRFAAGIAGHRVPLASQAELGESALWPTAAVLTAASLYATLPSRFIAGPSAGVFSAVRWIVPGLTIVLLAALVLSAPRGTRVRSIDWHAVHVPVERRILSLAVIAVLSAANGAAVVLLVHLLVTGAKAHAALLLRAAIHMWCTNVLVFALWFWQLDGGGPVERVRCALRRRDFLFPQDALPEFHEDGWRPAFLDYLYLSFTNATAFSPTDAMPLSRWAKMLMLVQSAASLLLAIMVVSRAVNILQ